MPERRDVPHQREYLMTLQELYDASLVNLGPMDTKPYRAFVEAMGEVAREKSVRKPLMVIDISLKEPSQFGVTEQPYPIVEDEWDIFISHSRTMANFMPNVHVVDGDKYILPI